MKSPRGMIPAQVPPGFGVVADPSKNMFMAKRLLLTFAQVQREIDDYRKGQANPATRKPEIQA